MLGDGRGRRARVRDLEAPEASAGATYRTIGLDRALAIALLALFVVIERRSTAPLIRMGIFRSRTISGSNTAMILVAGGMYAFF